MKGFDHMTDSEVVKYAYDNGYEQFVVTNHDGELINREELIDSMIEVELCLMWEECDPAGGYGLYSHV